MENPKRETKKQMELRERQEWKKKLLELIYQGVGANRMSKEDAQKILATVEEGLNRQN